jgi:hypothetical protein
VTLVFPPSFTFTSVTPDPASAGQTVTIVFDASETLISAPTVTVEGAAADPGGQVDLTYTYTYVVQPGDLHGTNTILVSGDDLSSNTGTATTTVEFDMVDPVISAVSVSPDPAREESSLSITFTVSEDVVAAPTVTVDGSDATPVDTIGPDYQYSYAVVGPPTDTEGPVSVDISCDDMAGNNGTGTGSVVLDFTAPTVTVDTLTTTDSTPPLSGTVDDASATISVLVDGQTRTAVNNGATWTLADDSLASLAPGTYDVSVTATDAAGNAGTDATIAELVIFAIDIQCSYVSMRVEQLEQDYAKLLEYRIDATGSFQTGAFDLEFYLSTNTVAGDGDDVLIGTDTISAPGITAGSSYQGRAEVTASSGSVAAGSYYVVCIVDSGDAVDEVDEGNNAHIETGWQVEVLAAGSGGADLAAIIISEAFDSPTFHAQAGDPAVPWPLLYYGNNGTRHVLAADGAVVRFYASNDQVIGGGDDTQLAEYACGDVLAGDAATMVATITLDLTSRGIGTHYLYALIDATDAVAELPPDGENNNDSVTLTVERGSEMVQIGMWVVLELTSSSPVAPDLVIGGADADEQFQIQTTTTVDYDVTVANACLTVASAASSVEV